MSDNAENLENLPDGYYENMCHGKDQAWVDVYVHGRYGFIKDGRPIFPEYNDEIHAATEVIEPIPGLPVYVGIDFGLTPAATFAQFLPIGRWVFVDEIVSTNMGAVRFSELLKDKMSKDFHGFTFMEITGDPAGEQRAQTDEQTPFDILLANGVDASPAPTNDFTIRRESLARLLMRLAIDGKPSLIVSPKCRMLRKALAGAYKYRRLAVAGEDKFADKPDKGPYSHVAESAEYLLLGAGEGDKVVMADSSNVKDVRVIRNVGGIKKNSRRRPATRAIPVNGVWGDVYGH